MAVQAPNKVAGTRAAGARRCTCVVMMACVVRLSCGHAVAASRWDAFPATAPASRREPNRTRRGRAKNQSARRARARRAPLDHHRQNNAEAQSNK